MTGYYLTPSDYEVAEQMGIDRNTLYSRVYRYNWSILRATTTPKKQHFGPYKDFKEVCDKNGITKGTFYERIRRGYTPEEAATKKVNPGIKREQNFKLTQELFDIAKENGIEKGTVESRVYQYKWSVKRAITEPVNTKYRRKA
jgi:predicted DNA-binding protein YlxM (UPF0122 family)